MADQEWLSESGSENDETDKELQALFAAGKLRGSLRPLLADPKKKYCNNVEGLNAKFDDFAYNGDWIEQLDVTVPRSVLRTVAESSEETGETSDSSKTVTDDIDANDDFKREACFYRQAQAAVVEALPRLKLLCVHIQRPNDYFAEMVKGDDHMRRIREHLLSQQKAMEQAEKTRKQRELKKFGKKVQQNVLERRRQEKRQTLDAVKQFRRDRSKRPDFLGGGDDDDFPVTNSGPAGKNKKRQMKESRFGFGGKKRLTKSNTASSTDEGKFSLRHNGKLPAGIRKGNKGKGKNARAGKSHRQTQKRGKK